MSTKTQTILGKTNEIKFQYILLFALFFIKHRGKLNMKKTTRKKEIVMFQKKQSKFLCLCCVQTSSKLKNNSRKEFILDAI